MKPNLNFPSITNTGPDAAALFAGAGGIHGQQSSIPDEGGKGKKGKKKKVST
jgi:hypothetical protein